ncbi:flagellar hook-basal body complex protein FliE [Rhodobacter capsulatus]|uniref:Flagellar hook-basal body complex protein FliE n=1 Tax=Rhodobacter capsulatus TaxID=1061 RepID=A0A4U1K2M6_RHOCA|nr:flagellar hook-basal body complex protein FliE [Rhodobacter capsulatus]TKD26116.1 flagellar hook-basal body complex protein FliE [Rhodobacter capsulatus]
MDIKTSLATQGYAQARSAATPLAGNSNADRDGGLGKIATSFLDTMQQSEDTAKAAMLGNADPHTLVQALAQTELAVETAVTVRNKVVEAYQEILRMPV